MLSKSANPLPATPSQAPTGEGVETGWEPPDRVRAKVKAQSRPRTLVERRRKPKWYGIRRVLVRAQEGQSRSGGWPAGRSPLLRERAQCDCCSRSARGTGVIRPMATPCSLTAETQRGRRDDGDPDAATCGRRARLPDRAS